MKRPNRRVTFVCVFIPPCRAPSRSPSPPSPLPIASPMAKHAVGLALAVAAAAAVAAAPGADKCDALGPRKDYGKRVKRGVVTGLLHEGSNTTQVKTEAVQRSPLKTKTRGQAEGNCGFVGEKGRNTAKRRARLSHTRAEKTFAPPASSQISPRPPGRPPIYTPHNHASTPAVDGGGLQPPPARARRRRAPGRGGRGRARAQERGLRG